MKKELKERIYFELESLFSLIAVEEMGLTNDTTVLQQYYEKVQEICNTLEIETKIKTLEIDLVTD